LPQVLTVFSPVLEKVMVQCLPARLFAEDTANEKRPVSVFSEGGTL
jgi:hypothetical protein